MELESRFQMKGVGSGAGLMMMMNDRDRSDKTLMGILRAIEDADGIRTGPESPQDDKG